MQFPWLHVHPHHRHLADGMDGSRRPRTALQSAYIVPDLDGSRFIVTPTFYAVKRGLTFRATLRRGQQNRQHGDRPAVSGVPVILPVSHPKTWSPESPFLYDLDLDVLDEAGTVLDHVVSYAGLRKVHVEDGQVFLNNQPFFLRLVLDQGFYPDGIWTAPSDEALKRDIRAVDAGSGFNGARLHQKVFEERFHYWADRLGYLTWGESSSWGIDVKEIQSARNFLSEWREIVCRDRNHPSIIAWTPFNETWDTGDRRQHNRLHIDAYELTRALDPTRPVNDASGYAHARTDLWTVHTYEQSPKELAELMDAQRRAALAQLPRPRGGVRRPALHRGRVRRHQVGPGRPPALLGNLLGLRRRPALPGRVLHPPGRAGAGPVQPETHRRLLLHPAHRCGAGAERHL